MKCDLLSDAAKTVLILGYDSTGNWIRTTQGGVVADGEVVALAQGAGTLTVNTFSKITGIQAPTNLDGQWWAYLGSTAGTLLGNYQWFDVVPSWKRYLIPFINATVTTVEIMGKLAFFPVKNDADFLIIGNLAALKLQCKAIISEENNSWQEAQLLSASAIQELELELDHQLGAGRELGISIKGSNIGSIEPVPALM